MFIDVEFNFCKQLSTFLQGQARFHNDLTDHRPTIASVFDEPDWVSLRTQYVDAGLKNVSLSNFHGVAVRNATIYGKYFPTHTGSKLTPSETCTKSQCQFTSLFFRRQELMLFNGSQLFGVEPM